MESYYYVLVKESYHQLPTTMPDIQLSDSNFQRLQHLAVPFTDTPDTVVGRLLNHFEDASANGSARNGQSDSSAKRLEPDAPDDLSFTRVRAASFGNVEIGRPNWNKLVRTAHTEALKALGSFAELVRVSQANMQQGRVEDNGFRYVPSADISIQGLPASLAWQHSLQLARKLNIPIQTTVEWMNREGAAHPGETAILEWKPSS